MPRNHHPAARQRRLESVTGGDRNDMHERSHFDRHRIMSKAAMIAGGYGSRRAAIKQIIARSEAVALT